MEVLKNKIHLSNFFSVIFCAILLTSCTLDIQRTVKLDPDSEYDFAYKPGYILDDSKLYCKAEGLGVLWCVKKGEKEPEKGDYIHEGKIYEHKSNNLGNYIFTSNKRYDRLIAYLKKTGQPYDGCSTSYSCVFSFNDLLFLHLLWRNQERYGNRIVSLGINNIHLTLPQAQKYLQGEDDDLTKIRSNDAAWVTDQLIQSMNTHLSPEDRVTLVKPLELRKREEPNRTNGYDLVGQFTVMNAKGGEVVLNVLSRNTITWKIYTGEYQHN